MKKIFLFASVFFIFTARLFSQTKEVKTFTLKNGLSIYVLKDETNALVYTEFVCKAGISSQTSSTAGFFPLYTKLFHTSADAEHQDIFDLCNLKSECKADGASYTAEVPLESLDAFLEGLASCVNSPSIEQDAIQTEYFQMRKNSLEYSQSLSGFINSSIDSRIFSKEPWKHDTGIYAPLFNSYSPSEVRSILYKIANDYYVPRNSALFFCGNIDEEKIYQLCEKNLGSWKENKKSLSDNFEEYEKETSGSSGKKFVLISDEFSPQYTQLVVQFTSLTLSQADLLSTSFSREDSLFIEKLTSGSMIIPSSQYVNASSIQNKDYSRLILQSLIEYNSTSFPQKQAESFVQIAKEAAVLKRKNFIQAQNDLKLKYELQSANSTMLCSTLADFWLMSDSPSPQNFLQEYNRTIYNFQSLNEKEIAKKMLSEDPYIFILLNTRVYKAYEKQFKENGYELVTEKNGSWYTNELLAKLSQNEKKQNLAEKKDDEKINTEDFIHGDQAEKFYNSNIESFFNFELENGIPLYIKEVPHSQTVCIGLKINPKEEADSEEFEILSDYIAKKCSKENAFTESQFNGTMIVLEVHKDKVEETLKNLSEAIVFAQITPTEADEIFSSYNYKRFLEKGNLTKQMQSKILFPKKSFGKKQTLEDYKKLVETYNKLLDASLYSIIAVGDVSSQDFKTLAEKYFGFIKEVSERDYVQPYILEESTKIKNIEIEHTFTTDKSAASAPKESPVLIPTKEFLDPAQIYFDSPEYNLAVYNSLLMELYRHTEKKLDTANCSFFEAKNSFAGGIISCEGIKKASKFFDAYKEARDELLAELSNDEKKEDTAKKIKSLWIQKKLSGTKNNFETLLLVAEGTEKNKAEQYLLDYIDVQNAEAEDYVQLLNDYFTAEGKFRAKSKNN